MTINLNWKESTTSMMATSRVGSQKLLTKPNSHWKCKLRKLPPSKRAQIRKHLLKNQTKIIENRSGSQSKRIQRRWSPRGSMLPKSTVSEFSTRKWKGRQTIRRTTELCSRRRKSFWIWPRREAWRAKNTEVFWLRVSRRQESNI